MDEQQKADFLAWQEHPTHDEFVRGVLDHGHVRLVDHMGSDLSIVRAARVSYDAAWRAGEDSGSDEKLIRYLMRNKHTTPFEMVEFTFDVKMPIFVARQWVRHRTASINEVSARYTQLPREFYVPMAEDVGVQSSTSKQARVISDEEMFVEERANREADLARVYQHCEAAYALYEHLMEREWPRELARMVLPLNTYTHWFWKIDLHNLMHFLKLRLHEHAQYEIRVYAEAILELIEPIAPVAIKAFKEYGLGEQV